VIDTTFERLDKVGQPEEGMDPKVVEALQRVQVSWQMWGGKIDAGRQAGRLPLGRAGTTEELSPPYLQPNIQPSSA